MTDPDPGPVRRPWTLWGISLIVLLTGVANGWLAYDHVRHAAAYRALGVSYPPLLRAALAAGWGALLVTFGVGLFRRRQWARRWVVVLLSNYGAFGVLWLIVFARSDSARQRIAFQAVATLGLVMLLAWMMRWRRVRDAFAPSNRRGHTWPEQFAENRSHDEDKPENRTA